MTCAVLAIAPIAAHGEAAPPPEVKKTVEAFAGHWTVIGTDLEPGANAPAAIKGTVDCTPAALGAAVSCLIAVDIGGSRIEAANVIGYSPDEHQVRWMEISSTGEYHDHRGPWRGNAIQFEPLTYTAGGTKLTEFFTPSFPSPGTMVWKVSVETAQGTSKIDLTGTRGTAKAK